eukprot:7766721-Pyramimonas_sp.AAC.1
MLTGSWMRALQRWRLCVQRVHRHHDHDAALQRSLPGWWRRYCVLLCSDAALQRLPDLWYRCSVGAFVSVQLQPWCPCIA